MLTLTALAAALLGIATNTTAAPATATATTSDARVSDAAVGVLVDEDQLASASRVWSEQPEPEWSDEDYFDGDEDPHGRRT